MVWFRKLALALVDISSSNWKVTSCPWQPIEFALSTWASPLCSRGGQEDRGGLEEGLGFRRSCQHACRQKKPSGTAWSPPNSGGAPNSPFFFCCCCCCCLFLLPRCLGVLSSFLCESNNCSRWKGSHLGQVSAGFCRCFVPCLSRVAAKMESRT